MTAKPTTVSSWETYLATLDTPEKFKAAYSDDGDTGFKANLKNYVEAKNAERDDIIEQVKQTTQDTIVEMFRAGGLKTDNPKALNSALLAGQKASIGGRNAPGAALNGTFGDIGEFVGALWHGNKAPTAEQAAAMSILNGYSEKIPDAGGFLVPEEFRQDLLMLELEDSIVLPRATVIPMNAASLTFPTVDATSNVSSVYGGIVVYRTDEGEEFVESQAKFGKVKLDPTKQTALAYVTNEVIRDGGGALTAFLMNAMPKAMAFAADYDYMNASGAGEPMGALNAGNPGMIVVAKEAGQGANTIVWENILRMYARMLPSSLKRAVWVASPDTFFELATMALTVGTGGSAVWIMDAHGAPQLTLLGRPVIMTEKTPSALGGQGDISFVDFGSYLIGRRDAMSIDTSPHVKFTSDQTTIRVIERNDGRPWLTSPITPKNGGATLSPFVQLAVRA